MPSCFGHTFDDGSTKKKQELLVASLVGTFFSKEYPLVI
jgi:hypothetical protein